MLNLFPRKTLRALSINQKITLSVVGGFLLIGVCGAIIIALLAQSYQREIAQKMHRDLAKHVVHEYRFFNPAENKRFSTAKEAFHKLMVFGPNFEFYLLDNQGKILTYSADSNKIKRTRIHLNPIETFLQQQKHLSGPILGDDPRDATRQKVFSAAPIIGPNNIPQGYLYVVLHSEIYDGIANQVFNSKILTWGLWLLTSCLLIAITLTLSLTYFIMRPLKQLNKKMYHVADQGFIAKTNKASTTLATNNSQQNIDPINGRHVSSDEITRINATFDALVDRLNEQYQQVITVDDLRKELLSHISHDLRSPLASLLGYLETWEINQENVSADDAAGYIAIAKSNAHKISRLIEQLFELAHLDSDNIQVNVEAIAIAELIGDVLQKHQLTAHNKDIQLDVSPQDSSITVFGDIEKLERVFDNLIENALRHTPHGGSIRVHLNRGSQGVAIEVTDNGIGIPQDDLPHVFDAHYKAGNSVRGNTAHGGLGLAITKKLLALHQSKINVKSHINRGTSFHFELRSA